MLNRYEKLFTPEYWSDIFDGKQPGKRFISKIMRICIASIRGFSDDGCSDKASALTFYTLLSIVPVLAVGFGIAKGFGFEESLKAEILQKFLDQKEIAEKIIQFAYSTLQSTQGGVIAGIGVIVLLWSVLKLLGNIENSFNSIWKVKQARPWSRKFSDYLAVIILCPIFFALSSSLSVFVTSQISSFTKVNGVWQTISPLLYWSLHILPLVLSWILFTAIYLIMPNTKVLLSCAVIAGIAAGTAYQILQWVYINFQFGISSYGPIYGSFAALPLFLIWLHSSWLIVLAGAEIAYHAENDMARSALMAKNRQQPVDGRSLGVMIAKLCISTFCRGLPPPSLHEIAQKLGISVVVARNIVHNLIDFQILSEVKWQGLDERYQPGCDPRRITLKNVCDALDESRHKHFYANDEPGLRLFEKKLKKLDQVSEHAKDNLTLIELDEKEESTENGQERKALKTEE